MGLSAVAMVAAALGALTPVAAAIAQEGIDVLVILNALRALVSGKRRVEHGPALSPDVLLHDHQVLEQGLDRLREIADALDDAQGEHAVSLVIEANTIVQKAVVKHEFEDEAALYPKLSKKLADTSGLAAMSRAHR
jgi:hypothetical protein